MKTRVVVTGMGAIIPIGNDVENFWQGLKDKTVGIAPITYFGTTDYKCRLAAEVKRLNTKDYMNAKAAHRIEASSQFMVAASKETLEHSGVNMEGEDPYRVGVCVGSGIGPLQAMGKDVQKLLGKRPSRVNPLLVPLMISNMAAGNVTIQLGLKGKRFGAVTACATGTHSIGEAFRSIRYGETDVMVAGGTEASITPIDIAGFTSLTALNTTGDPERASIPFDEDRNGFIMDESASAVILESLDHAKARGASIPAEVMGYGTACDAYHITSPTEDGSGAVCVMENAIRDAGIRPEDIDYVNAHGTSTYHNDLFEIEAIKLALGGHAGEVKINSIESMVDHLLGTTDGVEFITCVKSIEDRYIHATVGLEKPGEGYNLDYAVRGGVIMDVNVTISNSLGFDGHNVNLIVRKFSE